ncbi:MAG: NADH-quinone oxidoreductase subunit N [Alphaproteobacteria bacterium]|mgnify:FL=1|jgi:NADH-quinone oxidoreductase subunit N|tara:strand:- start:488 stop:1882 length:1395 start_codon:yes stop_codon:yes gene_type:complete
MINLVSFIPEILILTLIIVSLLTGLFYKASKNILTGINFLGFIFIAYLFISFGDSFQNVYSEIKDFNVIILSKIIISLFTALYILLINKSLSNDSIYRYEFLLFVLFATLGSFILISSNNFLTAFIGIELQSLSLYLMAAFNTKNLESNEAGIKYFSLGALSSGFLLFGISMVYFDNSSIQFSEIEHVSHFTEIGLALILIALFFKVSAAPFHIWTPDVYQGSPTISVLFFATLPKFASLIFLFRFFLEMDISSYPSLLFIFKTVCILSLLIGAYGAITQTVIKRLLAFSSINHIGFILLSILSFKFLSQGIFFFYLLIYLVTNFGVFSVLLTLRNSSGELKLISDLSGLKTHNKSKAIALLVLFFSLAGIPPFAGFFAKFFILTASMNEGLIYLSLIAVLSSVIAAFYYLRVIKNMFFNEGEKNLIQNSMFYNSLTYVVCSLFVTLFAFYPDPIILIINNYFN